MTNKEATTELNQVRDVYANNGRIFQEIIVEYPSSYNIYPEYEGKPYFLIKYTENGQEIIGYGTYKPEVLSEFLKEYFMPSIHCKDCRYFDKYFVKCLNEKGLKHISNNRNFCCYAKRRTDE